MYFTFAERAYLARPDAHGRVNRSAALRAAIHFAANNLSAFSELPDVPRTSDMRYLCLTLDAASDAALEKLADAVGAWGQAARNALAFEAGGVPEDSPELLAQLQDLQLSLASSDRTLIQKAIGEIERLRAELAKA
jgi:hypothetical protein